jgi:hypothetical protein
MYIKRHADDVSSVTFGSADQHEKKNVVKHGWRDEDTHKNLFLQSQINENQKNQYKTDKI